MGGAAAPSSLPVYPPLSEIPAMQGKCYILTLFSISTSRTGLAKRTEFSLQRHEPGKYFTRILNRFYFLLHITVMKSLRQRKSSKNVTINSRLLPLIHAYVYSELTLPRLMKSRHKVEGFYLRCHEGEVHGGGVFEVSYPASASPETASRVVLLPLGRIGGFLARGAAMHHPPHAQNQHQRVFMWTDVRGCGGRRECLIESRQRGRQTVGVRKRERERERLFHYAHRMNRLHTVYHKIV